MNQGLKYLLLPFLFISTLQAQDLQDILNSNEFKRYEKNSQRTQAGTLKNDNWLKKGENFSQLFLDRSGPKLLHLWLDTPNHKFKLVRKTENRELEFIAQEKTYIGPTKEKVVVKIMVPHPRYEDMAKYLLLEKFSSIQPPKLKVDTKEAIKINGFDANIYSLPEDGGHKIVLHLSKATLVTIYGSDKSKEDLLELANLLSFDRLDRKLRT